MKKTLTLIAALALFAAGAAAQQEVHDARNGMLDLIWDSDNEEIVMGSMVEARMEKSPAIAPTIKKDLDEFLTRDQDRALFDLPPLESEA